MMLFSVNETDSLRPEKLLEQFSYCPLRKS